MEAMEKHLIDIDVRSLDDLPDGAFLGVMQERGVSTDDLVACYEHDADGYCLCINCIDSDRGVYRGQWNGPEDECPKWLTTEPTP